MSYVAMQKTIIGEVPGVSLPLAKQKLNQALGNIYDSTDWSFQTGQNGWLCPGMVASVGTFTTTPYANTVVADASATAVLLAVSAKGRPYLTELQFRNPAYALYSIIGYDDGSDPVNSPNYPFATLTLDRVWMEPVVGPGQPYYIYQAYFPVPVADFRKFIEIRDTTNNQPVSFTALSQDDLSARDPQRLIFGPTDPTYAVPWGVDQRPGSPTLGNVMYEIWPHNLSYMPYSFSYKRRGPQLVDGADIVPYPITEDCVMWRARALLYQYKEAQKGENLTRGSGADWRFLSQAADQEWITTLKEVRAVDANLHRDFLTRPRRAGQNSGQPYSTNVLGDLNVGDLRS